MGKLLQNFMLLYRSYELHLAFGFHFSLAALKPSYSIVILTLLILLT